MPKSYHATFGAKWRRYVYLLPLRQPELLAAAAAMTGGSGPGEAWRAEGGLAGAELLAAASVAAGGAKGHAVAAVAAAVADATVNAADEFFTHGDSEGNDDEDRQAAVAAAVAAVEDAGGRAIASSVRGLLAPLVGRPVCYDAFARQTASGALASPVPLHRPVMPPRRPATAARPVSVPGHTLRYCSPPLLSDHVRLRTES